MTTVEIGQVIDHPAWGTGQVLAIEYRPYTKTPAEVSVAFRREIGGVRLTSLRWFKPEALLGRSQ